MGLYLASDFFAFFFFLLASFVHYNISLVYCLNCNRVCFSFRSFLGRNGRLGGGSTNTGSTNMPSKITVSQGTFSVFAEPPCSLTPLLIHPVRVLESQLPIISLLNLSFPKLVFCYKLL